MTDINNEVLEMMRTRSSCMSYEDRMPDKELIEAVAQAGAESPSAMNLQPWQITVVKDRKLISEIEQEAVRQMSLNPELNDTYEHVKSRGSVLFYNAPVVIVIAIDKNNGYAPTDCGIAAMAMQLAAKSVGLGSRMIALGKIAFLGDKAEELKKKLGFPENYEYGLGLCLGYEKESKEPHVPEYEKIKYID